MQDGIRQDVLDLFDMPGFPFYEGPMFTECGIPYFSTFVTNADAACEMLSDVELIECTEDRTVCRRLANHLYADGPLRVSQREGQGITDLNAFVLAKATDAPTRELMLATLKNVFSKAMVQ